MSGTLLLADNMGDTYLAAGANAIRGWSDTPTITSGRVAGGAHRLGSTSVIRSLGASVSELTVHAAHRVSNLTTGDRILFTLREGGTTHIDVRVKTDGSVYVARNGTMLGSPTATGLIGINDWHHYGLHVLIDDSAGEVDLWIDKAEGDSPDISLTSQDTKNGGTGVIDSIQEKAPGTNNGTNDVDDLHIWSGDDFKGDTRVIGQVAASAGSNADWTPLSDTNVEMVDEATYDGDTTYNADATSGNIDTFVFPGLGVGSGSKVYAVCPYAVARKDDAGTRSIAMVVRRGGTEYAGATMPLGTTYSIWQDFWEEDPDTAADWTVSGVNAGEYGYKDV